MLPLLPLGALALSAASGCSAKSASRMVRAGKLETPKDFTFSLLDAAALPTYKQTHREVVASWAAATDAGSYELCYDIVTSDKRNPGTPADWVQSSDQKNICTTIAAPATSYNGPTIVSYATSNSMDVKNPRLRAIPKAATSEPSDFATAEVGDKSRVKGVCVDKEAVPEDDVSAVTEVIIGSSQTDENKMFSADVMWKANRDYIKQAGANKKLTPVDKFVFEVCAGYVQEHDPATNVSSVLNCTVVSAKDATNTFNDEKNSFKWSQMTKLNESTLMSLVVSVRVINVCDEGVETLDFWASINSRRIYAVKPPVTPGLQADNLNDLDANNINMVAYLAVSSRTLPSSYMGGESQRLATITTYALDYSNRPNRGFDARLGAQGELRVGNTTCLVADGGAVAGNALIVDECGGFFDENYNNRTKWVADVKAEQTSLKLVQGATELCVGFTKTQSKYEAPLTLMACDAADDGQKFSFKNGDYQPPEKTEPAATSAAAAPAAAQTAPAS